MEGKDKSLPESSKASKEEKASKEKVYDFTIEVMKKLNYQDILSLKKEDFNKMKKIIIKWHKDVIIPEWQFNYIHSIFKINKPHFDKSKIIKLLIITIFTFYSYLKKEKDIHQLMFERLHIISLILVKLYDCDYFNCEDLLFFSKVFLYLSISDYKKNKLKDNYINLFSLLKISIEIMQNMIFNSDMLIHNFIFSEATYQSAIKYFDIFIRIILNNEINLYLLRRYEKPHLNIINFTKVLQYISDESQRESMKKKLIELIGFIYEFKFSYSSLLSPFLNHIQEALINIRNKSNNQLSKDFPLVGFSVDYINQIIQNESSILLAKDSNQLYNGLYISGDSSPLVISGFLLTYYTLIFSFKLSPLNNYKDTYTLLSIQEPNKDSSVHLKITLQKNNDKYSMSINQIIQKKVSKEQKANAQKPIEIIPNLTYICVLSFNKKESQLVIDCSCNNDKQQFTMVMSKNMINDNKPKVLLLGCEIENNIPRTTFEGYLGSIIYFDSIPYDNDFIKDIFYLKGRYENMLTLLDYDNSFINSYIGTNDKYHRVTQRIINWTSENNKMTFSDVIKKVKFYFSCNILRFSNYKDEIESYLNSEEQKDNNNNRKKTIVKNTLTRSSFVSNVSHSSSHSSASKAKIPEYSTKNINILGLKENSIGTIQLECCKYFNKHFHIFNNKETLFAFIENDGIYFLCLQFEYYYQILCQVKRNRADNNENVLSQM